MNHRRKNSSYRVPSLARGGYDTLLMILNKPSKPLRSPPRVLKAEVNIGNTSGLLNSASILILMKLTGPENVSFRSVVAKVRLCFRSLFIPTDGESK